MEQMLRPLPDAPRRPHPRPLPRLPPWACTPAAALQMISDARRIPPSTTPPSSSLAAPTPCTNPTSSSTATPSPPAAADIVVTGEEFVFLLPPRSPPQHPRPPTNPSGLQLLPPPKPRRPLSTISPASSTPKATAGDGIAEELVGHWHPATPRKPRRTPPPRPRLQTPRSPQPLLPPRVTNPSPPTASANTPPSPPSFSPSAAEFNCPYCPIPAYNQRWHRLKSGERIADEMLAALQKLRPPATSSRPTTTSSTASPAPSKSSETLARAEFDGVPLPQKRPAGTPKSPSTTPSR